MAIKRLPQDEADETRLTVAQIRRIKMQSSQGNKKSVCFSLFELDTA